MDAKFIQQHADKYNAIIKSNRASYDSLELVGYDTYGLNRINPELTIAVREALREQNQMSATELLSGTDDQPGMPTLADVAINSAIRTACENIGLNPSGIHYVANIR